MRRKLSLTLRLTALYALISSIVLSVLGLIIVSFLKSHFIEQDREELLAKQQSVINIVRQSLVDNNLEALTAKLDSGLNGHRDLIVQVQDDAAQTLYLFPKNYLQTTAPAKGLDLVDENRMLSSAQFQRDNNLLSAVAVVKNATQTLQLLVAVKANTHDLFM